MENKEILRKKTFFNYVVLVGTMGPFLPGDSPFRAA